MAKDDDPIALRAEIARLRDELEQAHTAAEDAAEEAARTARDLERAERELARHTHTGREMEQAMAQLHDQLRHSAAVQLELQTDQARSLTVEEELNITLEEMQLVIAELEAANIALRDANARLERRVTERTTALATANAGLVEAQARLSLALRAAEAGIWDWNIATGHMMWSDEYWKLHGLMPGEVIPSRESWLATILPEDRVLVEATLQTCLERHVLDFTMEYRIRHPGTGVRWLAARGRFLFDETGQPRRMIGLSIDTTERKEALQVLDALNHELAARVEAEVAGREAAQRTMFETQKLEALGQLTGGVAHDFNNLMTVVISALHLLGREPLNERQQRLLRRIQQASAQGAELTRRLLAFGRGQDLRPVTIPLPTHMQELRELLVHSLRENIEIAVICPEETWPVRADRGALELALLNLAVNARDAMPQGGSLTLSATNRQVPAAEAKLLGVPTGDYVELRITDTGTGMPEGVRQHAFEPFFTTKEPGKGTGLGLAQVYGFARQSGGLARIETRPDEGTSVILLLPRATDPALTEASAAPGGEPVLEPVSVLVVEDNAAVAESVTDMLGGMGHKVARASGMEPALEILASEAPIDVVLTDILLPSGRSGADVVRAVRRYRPQVPVVLTTGYGGEAISDPDLIGLPVVWKPYEPKTLATMLARALRSHPAEIQAAVSNAPPWEAPVA
ncbi:Histidine kinase [Rhodovastum atsumiense]|uniref:histidine kinase n=1 Tax=Rhodovastum atsumiense TaxID=504468 RepID=A0A5M6IT73_9PROT|nr:hybrid sensor histidine kinase/response regulator [Rhodovastum atsumiense]KAA5611411.1 PAS domain-containing protein [Rhodovastum atsumiense]CAH2603571.1 Histidine kinase [Rhodovastum atsumiense]